MVIVPIVRMCKLTQRSAFLQRRQVRKVIVKSDERKRQRIERRNDRSSQHSRTERRDHERQTQNRRQGSEEVAGRQGSSTGVGQEPTSPREQGSRTMIQEASHYWIIESRPPFSKDWRSAGVQPFNTRKQARVHRDYLKDRSPTTKYRVAKFDRNCWAMIFGSGKAQCS